MLAGLLQAATAKHTNIKDVLALFFRDDIIAWSARRSGRHASAGAGLRPSQLKQLVQANVEKTFERLKEVCFPVVGLIWRSGRGAAAHSPCVKPRRTVLCHLLAVPDRRQAFRCYVMYGQCWVMLCDAAAID